MYDLDSAEHGRAAGVSSDPESSQFSFSAGGRAFFVVGLYPNWRAWLAGLPRHQFDALRAVGRYDKLQSTIRQRDIALQGSINPVLVRFGESSEALQYSGKAAGGCPFRARNQ